MPQPYAVQEAMERLRQEIQTDRIATYNMIREGFEKLTAKFEEHANEDTNRFNALTDRVAKAETKGNVVGGVLAAIGTALTGVVLKMIFGGH